MTALLIVGCVLGYLLVGGVTSVVWGAILGEMDAMVLFIALTFWPILALFGIFRFPAMGVGLAWNWAVRKLNPAFEGWKQI